MPRRCLCGSLCLLLLCLASIARADVVTVTNGASPASVPMVFAPRLALRPAPFIFTEDVPPPPPAPKPIGIVGGITKLLGILRPSTPRERTERERERDVWLLGLRGSGISALGASVAGIGAVSGETMALFVRGKKLPVSFGPRVGSGGGGFTISMRW